MLRQAKYVELYRFYTSSGKHWRYAALQSDYFYDEDGTVQLYLGRTITRERTKVEVSASLEVVTPADAQPFVQYRTYFPAEKLWVKVTGVSYNIVTNTYTEYALFTGFLDEYSIDLKKGAFTGKYMSLTKQLNANVPNKYFSVNCRFNLFDNGCRVDKDELLEDGTTYRWHTGNIDVSDLTITGGKCVLEHADLMSENPMQYLMGNVVVYDAVNSSDEIVGIAPIIGYVNDTGDSTGTVRTLIPIDTELLSASAYVVVYAGCQKTLNYCRNIFCNEMNFGGFPGVKSTNPTTGIVDEDSVYWVKGTV